MCPHAACPRRLCQPPWTHTISKEPRTPRMGTQVRRKRQAYSQLLFGRGPGGGASLREAASPGVSPPLRLSGREREGGAFLRKAASLATSLVPSSRLVAAALSAAVTSTKLIGDRSHSQGAQAGRKDQLESSYSSGGSAREGLLSEKPPPSEFLHRYSVTHTAVTWAGRESVMIPLV